MQAYRLETTLTQNSTLTLQSLPFKAGEVVEVIILAKTPTETTSHRYPLRGLPVSYLAPTEPVAQTEWELAQ